MNHHSDPAGSVPRHRIRMDTGMDVLAEWSESATQSERNMVYKALFSVVDGTIFKTHKTVDDWQKLSEFFVVVRDKLVIKVCVHCFDSYGVVYIGPPESAPGVGIGSLGTGLVA